MGLWVSHDAFHAAYSAFNRFRQAVAEACGGSYPPHDDPKKDPNQWYWEEDDFSRETHPGLTEFFCHSDCDGEISPQLCWHVAKELASLREHPAFDDVGQGHILHRGGMRAVLDQFILGCIRAAAAGEPLEFH